MILNQRQCAATAAQIERLQTILELSKKSKVKMSMRVFNAMIAGIESQIEDLKNQIKEYEKNQL